MTLTLYVDTNRWRDHLARTIEGTPGLVPVIKGNGYGVGIARLAGEAARLGVDVVAVGETEEVGAVREAYDRDVLVLAPWRPEFHEPPADARVIRTVSHVEALKALAGTGSRVVVEVLTSMHRHGIPPDDLAAVGRWLEGVQFEGVALHLPMEGHHLAEARGLAHAAQVQFALPALWVSHLPTAQIEALRDEFPVVRVRPRIGTALWLGDRSAMRARATVLDVHRLRRGTTYGYRQRRTLRDSTLLVISGGTSHGIGLEAPRGARGLVSRGKSMAIGGLDAAGFALSPFAIGGKKRWYAEPPHMQVSLVLLPAGVTPPTVGDEVDVDVRMTTTYVDRIVDK